MNLNPRSLYNKLQNFKEYVSENDVDVVCVSESWEREEETIESVLNDDKLSVISNPFQRKGRGGRPIIIVNNEKYNVERIDVPCPWGVEMVWAIMSIKKATSISKIQKIVIGSFYSKPASRKKQILLDHISDVFHMMSSKFTNGLFFLICGDSNDLKLDSILHLSPRFRQIVDKPTRGSAILDPVITDLHSFYQKPIIEAPLQPDTDNGEDSDHNKVLVKPLNNIDNKIVIEKKTVEIRIYSEENFATMNRLLDEFDWAFLSQSLNVDLKMKKFQDSLFGIFDTSFPLKKKMLLSQSEPFYKNHLPCNFETKGEGQASLRWWLSPVLMDYIVYSI